MNSITLLLLLVLGFLTCLQAPDSLAAPTVLAHHTAIDSFQTVTASTKYQKSRFHQLFWGKHYRPVWSIPVKARVLDMATQAGGLKPLEKGGSFQTKNLRLANPDGKEYVLRSIDKDPTKALPPKWQKTFVAGIMQDQTSVIHPYGAFIVPVLAAAAGVHHTNPELVLVPDDPALGEFRQEFAGMLALLEERPDGDQEEEASFGNSKKVISSRKMFEKLVSNPCNQVDRRLYLRARLFDMWLGDWSRREDQWRWASFERGDRTTYQAIPRDRDHAFFNFNDGILTWLASKLRTNFQSFHKNINNVAGLNKSALPMDAFFLAGLSRQDFLEIADSLQHSLTDAVIRQATHTWPEQVYALSGKDFEEKLLSRRSQLPKTAEKYYRILAEAVLLPGTDKKEKFVVERLDANQTKVSIYSQSDSNCFNLLLTERIFHRADTKTISLFGLAGKDIFELSGKAANGITVRIYDGDGEDKIQDKSVVRTAIPRTRIYDSGDGNDIETGKHTKVLHHQPLAEEFSGEGWLLRHRLE